MAAAPDFAIVLLGTSSVAADDFIFGAPAAPAAFAAASTYGDYSDPTHDAGPRVCSSIHGDYALV